MSKEPKKERYRKIYQKILKDFRAQGIRIFHRIIDNETDGQYDPDTTYITIDPNIKDTLLGIMALCHERGHFDQHYFGEFGDFFKWGDDEIYTDEKLELAIEAEKDANKKAKRFMQIYGITKEEIESTPQFNDLEMREYYKRHYFKEE